MKWWTFVGPLWRAATLSRAWPDSSSCSMETHGTLPTSSDFRWIWRCHDFRCQFLLILVQSRSIQFFRCLRNELLVSLDTQKTILVNLHLFREYAQMLFPLPGCTQCAIFLHQQQDAAVMISDCICHELECSQAANAIFSSYRLGGIRAGFHWANPVSTLFACAGERWFTHLVKGV